MSKAKWVAVDVSGKLIIDVNSQINKLTPVIVGRCWQSNNTWQVWGRCYKYYTLTGQDRDQYHIYLVR